MTNEKLYEKICAMIYAYDKATNNGGAGAIIKDPDQFVSCFNPFYEEAAQVLMHCMAKMDNTRSGIKTAANHVIKAASKRRPDMAGVIHHKDKYVVCDTHRLFRFNEDIPSLPHKDLNMDFDKLIPKVDGDTLNLPEQKELKAYIAQGKAKYGKELFAYLLDGCVYVDPEYLLDVLIAFPDAVAYKPSKPVNPIVIKSASGDALLLPVNPHGVRVV